MEPPSTLTRNHRYFCYVCGKLLPAFGTKRSINCFQCKTSICPEWFQDFVFKYTFGTGDIELNDAAENDVNSVVDINCEALLNEAREIMKEESRLLQDDDKVKLKEEDEEGPSIRRECIHCNHQRMSYVTLQTRSADEGQTVIYTCLKCKIKEIEYS